MENASRTLDKLTIDHDFMTKIEVELGNRVGKILSEASIECDKLIKKAKAECDEILKGYGGEVVIQHNVNYNIKEN